MFSFCSMTDLPAIAAPPSDPDRDAPGACACGAAGHLGRERLAMLHELAQIGMRLARGVEREAEAPDVSAGDLVLKFARVARAVRQTLALETRIEGELATRAREDAAAGAVRLERETRARLAGRKTAIRCAVEQAIEAEADHHELEGLFDHLEERLQDRADTDFLDRPVGELVARICRDIGVTPDMSLWQDEDWAIAEGVTARPADAPEVPEVPEAPPPPAAVPPPDPPPRPYWDG
jgi:hypothetical protein